MSKLDRTELIAYFLSLVQGIKIDGTHYSEVSLLLKQHPMPAIKGMPVTHFTFQPDNASAHRAQEAVELSYTTVQRLRLTRSVAAKQELDCTLKICKPYVQHVLPLYKLPISSTSRVKSIWKNFLNYD